ncbi:MAG: AraC family transcriptional regulator [Bacteroidota bacterium]
MKKYDLHKNDFSKLHFELKALAPYFLRYKEKASKPHRHSFFQLLWFRERGKHYIDYDVIEHPENTLFFINQNQVHYFCAESSNEGYLFHFNASFISNLSSELLSRFSISIFNEIGPPFVHLGIEEAELLEITSQIIIREFTEKKANYTDIIIHQFLGLLYRIERLKKKKVTYNIDSNSDFSKIVKFKQLIVHNVDQNLSIQEIAKELGLSSKKLTSLTKQHTGLTPTGLIKEMKILEAKRMLASKSASIKEIAYSLGFDQPTYFTKYFKKETTKTPKQFQELLP